MYIEASGNSFATYTCICLKITFFYNRFSFLADKDHRVGCGEYSFSIISHIDGDVTTEKIPKCSREYNDRRVLLKLKLKRGQLVTTADQLQIMANQYYEQQIIEQVVHCLPHHKDPTLPTEVVTIMKTLKKWCNNNQEKGNPNGILIYDLNVDGYLEFLGFHENILKNELNNLVSERSDEELNKMILAYNKLERVIFLIRRAEAENLENVIELSTNDVMKFELLFFENLKGSGVRVINLIVTEKRSGENSLKCESCKHQLISMESIKSLDSFERWFKKKNVELSISLFQKSIKENFTRNFIALLLFLIVSKIPEETQFHERLPLRTEVPLEQMIEAKISTPGELNVIFSKRKCHIVIGCYGPGTSTVARKRTIALSVKLKDRLKGDEVLYFICCNLNYQLAEKQHIHNVQLVCYEEGQTLMDKVKEIVEKETVKKKIHIVAEQYGTEHSLDSLIMEVKKISKTFKKLNDTYLFVTCDPTVVERMKNMEQNSSYTLNRNSYEDFIKVVKLPYNNRNTVEIEKLVDFTMKILKHEKVSLQDVAKAVVEPIHCGHKIKSVKPSIAVINVERNNEESMIVSLSEILRQIKEGTYRDRKDYDTLQHCHVDKHVILHLGTQNNIPVYLQVAFRFLGMQEEVTDNYKNFKQNKDKKILISNYRTFLGNENESVIFILDPSLIRDIFCVPLCLSSALVFLDVVVLKRSISDKSPNSQTFQTIENSWQNQQSGSEPLFCPSNFKVTRTPENGKREKVRKLLAELKKQMPCHKKEVDLKSTR